MTDLTPRQIEALDHLIQAGLTDERRLKVLVDLVDGAQAWGWMRRFLLQAAAATGALSAIVAAMLLIRDWFTKQ